MKYNFYLFTTFIFSFSCAIGMDKEPEVHSVILLPNKQVAVAGKNGCFIFDQESRKPLHVVEKKEVLNITTNKDRTALVLLRKWKNPAIYDTKTNTKNILKKEDGLIYKTLNSAQNTVFFYKRHSDHLYSHNIINNEVKKFKIPYQTLSPSISCHPAKNELLFTYFDDECNSQLLIVQPDSTSLIKTKLLLDLELHEGIYSPDGHNIVISERKYGEANYFACDLNSTESPLPAYQLTADNKNYAAHSFHPKYSIIALLTTDNIIHFFDYIQRMLIAKTKKLINGQYFSDLFLHKHLDCDGKHLAATLRETWTIVDVPQKNFYEICKALLSNGLPKEVAIPIIANVISLHNQTYDYFDLKALLNTTPIQQPMPEANTNETPMELETEIKKIEAVYARPLKSPAIFGSWLGGRWIGDLP